MEVNLKDHQDNMENVLDECQELIEIKVRHTQSSWKGNKACWLELEQDIHNLNSKRIMSFNSTYANR